MVERCPLSYTSLCAKTCQVRYRERNVKPDPCCCELKVCHRLAIILLFKLSRTSSALNATPGEIGTDQSRAVSEPALALLSSPSFALYTHPILSPRPTLPSEHGPTRSRPRSPPSFPVPPLADVRCSCAPGVCADLAERADPPRRASWARLPSRDGCPARPQINRAWNDTAVRARRARGPGRRVQARARRSSVRRDT
jgi:hypothetical protein